MRNHRNCLNYLWCLRLTTRAVLSIEAQSGSSIYLSLTAGVPRNTSMVRQKEMLHLTHLILVYNTHRDVEMSDLTFHKKFVPTWIKLLSETWETWSQVSDDYDNILMKCPCLEAHSTRSPHRPLRRDCRASQLLWASRRWRGTWPS